MAEIYISTNGDPSVGIPGASAQLNMDVSWMELDTLELMIEELKRAFEQIWDIGKVYVEVIS